MGFYVSQQLVNSKVEKRQDTINRVASDAMETSLKTQKIPDEEDASEARSLNTLQSK